MKFSSAYSTPHYRPALPSRIRHPHILLHLLFRYFWRNRSAVYETALTAHAYGFLTKFRPAAVVRAAPASNPCITQTVCVIKINPGCQDVQPDIKIHPVNDRGNNALFRDFRTVRLLLVFAPAQRFTAPDSIKS